MYFIIKKKTAALVLSAVLLVSGAIFISAGYGKTSVPAISTDVNWGLSFQNDGDPPVGNASVQELQKLNAYYLGDTSQKTIHLTFDA